MKVTSRTITLAFVLSMGCTAVFAQNAGSSEDEVNFGYSKNPPSKINKQPVLREEALPVEELKPANGIEPRLNDDLGTENKRPVEVSANYESIADKTLEIARAQSQSFLKPTEIYRVGAGDVLFITLQESKSSYFTVLSDGYIDYPLAGGLISVEGLTTGEIAERLRDEIQLYENPEVSVSVKEHSSHAIDVVGMVARAGKQFLQREAMPLYVIRARAVAESGVTSVVITRNDAEKLVVKAETPEFDDTLIYPGDIVEFTSSERIGAANGFVYMGGEIKNSGRFEFFDGITLTQAIMTAGGVSSERVKSAVLTRKDEQGFLKSVKFKLSDIRKGKIIDPELEPGDMVEIKR